MSGYGIVIIICIAIGMLMYQRIKRFPLMLVDDAMQRYNYEKALETLNSASILKVIRPLKKDAMILRIYFMMGDQEKFEGQAKKILDTQYQKDDKNQVLATWFHECMAHEEKYFGEFFLNLLKQSVSDDDLTLYQLCYDVIINKIDCSTKVKELMNNYHHTDFKNGLYFYLFAYMHEQEENYKEALRCYDIALLNFDHDRSMLYYPHALGYIKKHGDESLIHFKDKKHEEKPMEAQDYIEKYRVWKKK